MVREVKWSSSAYKHLKALYEYILSKSYQNAEKVRIEILASTRKLSQNPEIHPPDKYRKDNDGSFRSYEIHKYRITYKFTDKEVIILRVRHTSMEPKEY